jgi:hypothetical protein
MVRVLEHAHWDAAQQCLEQIRHIILVQADAHIGTHVEMASHLRYSMSMLNTIVKNTEETEGSYTQWGPFSKERKSLKHSPLEKLESALAAWFKQVHESSASTDGTHLKEKALHIIACLGTANFSASNGWINRRHDIIYRTFR